MLCLAVNIVIKHTLHAPIPVFHYQGPVPRKMVKFNPGLGEILSAVFLLRARNSSLQNTAEPLL